MIKSRWIMNSLSNFAHRSLNQWTLYVYKCKFLLAKYMDVLMHLRIWICMRVYILAYLMEFDYFNNNY